jgi:hypothetical protein
MVNELQQQKKMFCEVAATCSSKKKCFVRSLQLAAAKKNVLRGRCNLQQQKKMFCEVAATCSSKKKCFVRSLQLAAAKKNVL